MFCFPLIVTDLNFLLGGGACRPWQTTVLWCFLICRHLYAWLKPCFNDDGALENTGLARAAGRSRQQKIAKQRCLLVWHLFRENILKNSVHYKESISGLESDYKFTQSELQAFGGLSCNIIFMGFTSCFLIAIFNLMHIIINITLS